MNKVYLIDSTKETVTYEGKYEIRPVTSIMDIYMDIEEGGIPFVVLTDNVPEGVATTLGDWLGKIGVGKDNTHLYLSGIDHRNFNHHAIKGTVNLVESELDKVYPHKQTTIGNKEDVMTQEEIIASVSVINNTLRHALSETAQDIYLMEDSTIAFKVKGEVRKELGLVPWQTNDYNVFLAMLLGMDIKNDVIPKTFYYTKIKNDGGTLDLHADLGASNFRCHLYTSFPKVIKDDASNLGTRANINIRVIPKSMPVLEDLNLPEIGTIFGYNSGLLLVAGRGNDGKSTTVASIVNHFNHMQDRHRMILTIEEPVEFVHEDKQAWIIQKRVGEGKDARSYATATEDAMREDTDIVVIQELRTQEEMHNALRLAEIGKMVIATIHANSVEDTIERFVNEFDIADKAQVRHRLNTNLLGIIHQNLIVSNNQQYPLVSMLLVTDDTTRRELIQTTSREDLVELMKENQNSTNILTQYDGGVHLLHNNLISKERFMELFKE